jgi:preprotein translocase subunit SecE
MKLLDFIGQVRQEMLKVTWPNKKEVLVSSVMVFVTVTIFALFFLLIDVMSHNAVQLLLGLGG